MTYFVQFALGHEGDILRLRVENLAKSSAAGTVNVVVKVIEPVALVFVARCGTADETDIVVRITRRDVHGTSTHTIRRTLQGRKVCCLAGNICL
jgi:hypothetical protein